MSFAGISGIQLDVNHKKGSPLEILFAEEVGWILEVQDENVECVLNKLKPNAFVVGKSVDFGTKSKINVSVNNQLVLDSSVEILMDTWEETSYHLELRQTNAESAKQEYSNLKNRISPVYKLTFNSDENIILKATS